MLQSPADIYNRRVVDDELDVLFRSLPAISIEGAKAVGKTATASQRARTVYALDDPGQRSIVEADPPRLLDGARPILIDEWQRFPPSWDLVRRTADDPRGSPEVDSDGNKSTVDIPFVA